MTCDPLKIWGIVMISLAFLGLIVPIAIMAWKEILK